MTIGNAISPMKIANMRYVMLTSLKSLDILMSTKTSNGLEAYFKFAGSNQR